MIEDFYLKRKKKKERERERMATKKKERGDMDLEIQIVKNTMATGMFSEVVKLTKEALGKYSIDKDIAGHIKSAFDSKHRGTWYVRISLRTTTSSARVYDSIQISRPSFVLRQALHQWEAIRMLRCI